MSSTRPQISKYQGPNTNPGLSDSQELPKVPPLLYGSIEREPWFPSQVTSGQFLHLSGSEDNLYLLAELL